MDDEDRAAVPVLKEEKEALWALLGNEFEDRILAALVKKELVLAPGHRESNVILGSDDTTRKSTTLLPADAFELFSVSSHNELNVEAGRGTGS
jgi:hypothetical protein